MGTYYPFSQFGHGYSLRDATAADIERLRRAFPQSTTIDRTPDDVTQTFNRLLPPEKAEMIEGPEATVAFILDEGFGG